jgi:glycosyltransferase involved in cell wall biosynthesis
MGSINLPLVSIVFTSYNHQEYLKQALDSLINQTYRNFEIIVIDDNSTDGSQKILEEYRKYPNVSLHLLEKNTGSYVKASNYGAGFAKGEYLMFAQCDDFSEPQQVERVMQVFFEHNNVGVVYSKSNMVDESGYAYSTDYAGREKAFKIKCAIDTVISRIEMRNFLSFACVIPNLSAAILKKKLFDKAGGLSTDYLVAADWAFWLDLSERTDFYYITEALNNFRQHSTTIRSKVKMARQIEEIYTIFYKHISTYRLDGKYKQKLKTGAGAVWFWYFLENKGPWLSSFPGLLKKTFTFEKLNFYYLSAGFFKHFKEHFNK